MRDDVDLYHLSFTVGMIVQEAALHAHSESTLMPGCVCMHM